MKKKKKKLLKARATYCVLHISLNQTIESDLSHSQLSVLSDLGIATTVPEWSPLIIKYKKIEAFYEYEGTTRIYLNAESYVVKETMSEIMDLIYNNGKIRKNRGGQDCPEKDSAKRDKRLRDLSGFIKRT